ncbi:MAG: hypothetical protein KOO69_04700 [Victivallales bacterium]|nr:hypothetical protein [Victivallales bacterium]
MTQRIKHVQKDYLERLTKHYAVIIAAMKAKQNVLRLSCLTTLNTQNKRKINAECSFG